jgi:hypothetical protein
MLPLLLSHQVLPAMVIVWFFDLFPATGGEPTRFGPYLTEKTCEAVRVRVLGGSDRRAGASQCFKSSVQENNQIAN